MTTSHWRHCARLVIEGVVSDMPSNATTADTLKAIQAAKPREFRDTSWGQKCWALELRIWKVTNGLPVKSRKGLPGSKAPIIHESPMERAKRKTLELQERLAFIRKV